MYNTFDYSDVNVQPFSTRFRTGQLQNRPHNTNYNTITNPNVNFNASSNKQIYHGSGRYDMTRKDNSANVWDRKYVENNEAGGKFRLIYLIYRLIVSKKIFICGYRCCIL